MKSQKTAKPSFQFERFKITRSLFNKKEGKASKSLSVGFLPKAKFYREENRFELFLGIRIEDSAKKVLIEVDSIAEYKLVNVAEKQLNNYFYINAPAILFPYLRAYIASLTTLSGYMNPIILPTFNLTSLASDLEKNTEII